MKKTRIVIFVSALALLATACGGGGGSDGEKSVTFFGWGGTGQEAVSAAWFTPFTKKTGIKVIEDNPVSFQKLEQAVKADNVPWSVVDMDSSVNLTDNPSLQDIDCSVVACDEFKGGLFPLYKQAVPAYSFSVVIAYNSQKYTEADAPSGWRDFFDSKRFPGKRLMRPINEGWAGQLEAALLTDGVDRDKLYPLDVDRALKVFDKVKDDLVVMADDAQCVTNVASGEAVMGSCYNGRTQKAAVEGQPVKIAWGMQNLQVEYFMVPKGAPNSANAQKLIAYSVSKEHNGALSSVIGYDPANPLAKVAEDSKWRDGLGSLHKLKGDEAPIVYDSEWWQKNRAQVIEKLAKWIES